MTTATVTSKGQVTIPASVRAALGISTGDRLDFVEMDNGQFAIIAATKSVQSLKGLIRKPAQPVSIDDMNAAIEAKGASAQ
jgi:AbrB family looped-hinge helix DNA binding protein